MSALIGPFDHGCDNVVAMSTPAAPLTLGRHTIASPFVLAPMAGITNRAFRRLCREYADTGVYVSEMVTSRALIERHPETMRLIEPAPGEHPRSVQLYGVDPSVIGAAVRLLVEEDRADHIDLNVGCPVPKVTRKGGGAALPWKRDLFAAIVGAAVRQADRYDVPVTVKMRMGIDEDHLTYLDAGRAAARAGVAAVALHARTAAQHYSGQARWEAIARLKEALDPLPVLGNGDIWSGDDAAAMMAQTGCDGVVVGRGCLGRPWLFADIAAALSGFDARRKPPLGEVADVMRRHADYLVEHYDGDELKGCRDLRKHIAWYLKGFPAGSLIRQQLALVTTRAELDGLLDRLDSAAPWPGPDADGPRGRAGQPKTPALPEGWLDSPDLSPAQEALVRQAEVSVSGG
jgi:nifR3 family TIM-barrel protein